MIGSGLIGGKSVGMLLARAILKNADPRWNDLLEAHDSFFIGSNVFCSFMVENGCWWLRQKQRDPSTLSRRHRGGAAPRAGRPVPAVPRQGVRRNARLFRPVADHRPFEQPAGRRLRQRLLRQVRERLLRQPRAALEAAGGVPVGREDDLRQHDEREGPALPGASAGCWTATSRCRFWCSGSPAPATAASSFRRSPAWGSRAILTSGTSASIRRAGVVRLVFGLGTRAVDRADDDYTRIVALNAPERRPEGDLDGVRQFCQRKVDLIDLEANHLVTRKFADGWPRGPRLPLHIFASVDGDRRAEKTGSETPSSPAPGAHLRRTALQDALRRRHARDAPRASASLRLSGRHRVHREFPHARTSTRSIWCSAGRCKSPPTAGPSSCPTSVDRDDCILEAHGAVIGKSRVNRIDRLVYVVPSVYGQLPLRDRYSVARLIGRLLHAEEPQPPEQIMLIGPGRWGTTTPSLGVPVSFAEIDTATVLCEIVAMREDLVPDVSLGTHFFNDLVEMDILYLALFPGRKGNSWNHPFFEQTPNRLGRAAARATAAGRRSSA